MLRTIEVTSITESLSKYKKDEKVTFEDAMTETGFGKFNVYVVLFCGFMLLGMIMETLGFSFIIPASQCDLDLNLVQKTWISVIPFIAIIVTSHMWGYLADTRGRKKILILCTSIGSIVSILSSFAPNTVTFGIMRFIAGLFIAGPSALGYAYLGELNPKAQRDMMLTLGNASVGLGTAIVPLISWGVLGLTFHWDLYYLDFRPWRLLVCICALPYLICSVLILKFPESPKFLAARGHNEEALYVLKHIYSVNTGKNPESFSVPALKNEGSGNVEGKKSFLRDVWNQTVPLFRKRYLKYTALTCFLQFVVFASTNGYYIWFPVVINKLMSHVDVTGSHSDSNLCTMFSSDIPQASHSHLTNHTVAVCDDTLKTSAFTITICISLIVATLTAGAAFLVRIVQKKYILATVFTITAIAGFVLNWITGTIFIVCMLAIIQINGLCIGVINAYVVEIFPTNFRAMAVCLTLMAGRVGSMFGSNTIGFLLHTQCPATFFLFSGLILSCTILALCLPTSHKSPEKVENGNNS